MSSDFPQEVPQSVAVFQHAESEGPGYLRTWMQAHGHTLDFVRWWERPVEEVDSRWSGCIILGGAMNIYQHRDHPWLAVEKKILGELLAKRIPTLGICLGAQLLADQLGGRVFQNSFEEIGWWPVDFSPQAAKKIPGLPDRSTFLHWHGDTFSLPVGAVPLGESAACPRQGFLFDSHVVALQFHPEVDGPLLEDFCGSDSDVWPAGPWIQSREEILDQGPQFCGAANQFLDPFLEYLFPDK